MTAQDALDQAKSRWTGLTAERRRLLGMGAVAAVLLGAGAYFLSSYTPYTTVYTHLTPAAAGQVTQALGQMKTPYRLSGTSISVPASEADQVRVDLATQNLPATGQVGYQNVLTSIPFGVTDQQFSLEVLNALQNDLDTTIETMNGVHGATVEIVEPTQSAFALPAPSAAKASVYVSVGPAGTLPASEVRGITELVSHAVPGLAASAVTVVDQAGQLLSATAKPSGGASPTLRAEQAVEGTLDQQITQLLTPVLGPGNLAATVNVALSLERQTTVEHLNGNAGKGGTPVVASRSGSKENYKGTGGATPPAGTSGNVPTYPTTASGSGASAYTTTKNSVTYAVNKVERTIVNQPVTVGLITASILVNAKVYPGTTAHLAQIRALVARTLGLTNAQAALDVTVAAVPFASAPLPAATKAFMPSVTEAAGAGGGLLLLGLLLGLATRRRGRRSVLTPVGVLPMSSGALPSIRDALPRDEAVEQEAHMLADITQQARQNPENVAELLRGWLREDA